MFLLSIVVLDEAVSREMVMSFALIWAGVLVMIVNAILQTKKTKVDSKN